MRRILRNVAFLYPVLALFVLFWAAFGDRDALMGVGLSRELAAWGALILFTIGVVRLSR